MTHFINRLTVEQKLALPSGTLSALQALARSEGALYYATDTDSVYIDDGSELVELGSSAGVADATTSSKGKVQLSDSTPEAVSVSGSPGTSSEVAVADHVHAGVHSIAVSGQSQLLGDVTVSAGQGIGLSQSGQGILITASGLTVSEIDGSNTITNASSGIHTVRFDKDTGFQVSGLGDGAVKVSLGSSFKTWEVSGSSPLVAVGEDTVEFIAGSGISITTSPGSDPQSITIASTVDLASALTGSITNGDTTHAPTADAVYDALALKEPAISAGTSGQYWRGDKSWQTLDKSAVGLGNVPNTDATARSSHTGTQTASTISDFDSAARTAVIASSISDNDTTHAPSGDAVFDALAGKQATITGAATTIASSDLTASKALVSDSSGKVSASSVSSTTLGYLDATSSVQTQLNAKQATITGAATTITSSDLTASKALVSDASGKVAASSVSSTTLGYLDATSSVQTQLNAKEPSITAGTTGQYWRGDKSFQTLDKSAVGLGNVPNTDATARANHTGTQAASTISDFTAAVQAVTIDAAKIGSGVVSNSEFAFLDGVSSAIQTQIDGKQATITGGATTITSSNLTASKALVSDASGKVAVSSVSSTTLGYLDATSSVQTQIDGKQATVTGAATTITSSNLTASKALVSDSSGKVAASSVSSTTLGYLDATSSVQTQIDGKQATVTGAATTITSSNLTASKALVSDASGKVSASSVTATELSYLSGTSSAIQTQFSSLKALFGYDAIVGSASGATHQTIGDAITAVSSGATILVLSGTYTENLSLSKRLSIYGIGYSTQVSGSITLASGSSYSHVRGMRFSTGITINSGVTGCFIHECWQATGQTITDSGTGTSLIVYQE